MILEALTTHDRESHEMHEILVYLASHAYYGKLTYVTMSATHFPSDARRLGFEGAGQQERFPKYVYFNSHGRYMLEFHGNTPRQLIEMVLVLRADGEIRSPSVRQLRALNQFLPSSAEYMCYDVAVTGSVQNMLPRHNAFATIAQMHSFGATAPLTVPHAPPQASSSLPPPSPISHSQPPQHSSTSSSFTPSPITCLRPTAPSQNQYENRSQSPDPLAQPQSWYKYKVLTSAHTVSQQQLSRQNIAPVWDQIQPDTTLQNDPVMSAELSAQFPDIAATEETEGCPQLRDLATDVALGVIENRVGRRQESNRQEEKKVDDAAGKQAESEAKNSKSPAEPVNESLEEENEPPGQGKKEEECKARIQEEQAGKKAPQKQNVDNAKAGAAGVDAVCHGPLKWKPFNPADAANFPPLQDVNTNDPKTPTRRESGNLHLDRVNNITPVLRSAMSHWKKLDLSGKSQTQSLAGPSSGRKPPANPSAKKIPPTGLSSTRNTPTGPRSERGPRLQSGENNPPTGPRSTTHPPQGMLQKLGLPPPPPDFGGCRPTPKGPGDRRKSPPGGSARSQASRGTEKGSTAPGASPSKKR